jgi:hypothetical protein
MTAPSCQATVGRQVEVDVTKSYARPRVSNDNPFSQLQFRTLQYRAYFRRGSSRSSTPGFCPTFFGWYNNASSLYAPGLRFGPG